MNDTLATALQCIAAESPNFARSFEAVDALLQVYGEEDLANRIVSDVEEGVDWRIVADLLGLLQWSTSDNGSAIAHTAEQWLRDGSDERRANIALHLETYPFSDKLEMETILESIARRFPSTRDRCTKLIHSRP